LGDVFDPAEVYLAGTVHESACYRDVLAHWSTPDVAAAGFDCEWDNRTAQVRPTDGRLLYGYNFEQVIHEFRCDVCPYTCEGCSYAGANYPDVTVDNDPVLPNPCPGGTHSGFLIWPDGSLLHRCYGYKHEWYDSNGRIVYSDPEDPLIHVGHGGLGLTHTRVVDLVAGSAVPFVGAPPGPPLTARARLPGGFLAVFAATDTPDAANLDLWEIDEGGVATLVGSYPPLPPDTSAQFVFEGDGRLEASGVLIQFGGGAEVFEDIILRREIGKASEVVYTEASDPLVKIHISALFTGP
jgi:hypothetical protein